MNKRTMKLPPFEFDFMDKSISYRRDIRMPNQDKKDLKYPYMFFIMITFFKNDNEAYKKMLNIKYDSEAYKKMLKTECDKNG